MSVENSVRKALHEKIKSRGLTSLTKDDLDVIKQLLNETTLFKKLELEEAQSVREKHVPTIAELHEIVSILAKAWLTTGTMRCEVCGRPATCVTVEHEKNRMCGTSLCDDDKGNRKVDEDFRAPMIRAIQKYLKNYT